MKKLFYQKHPVLLNELYKKQGLSGANSSSAKILFVGRDPNSRMWE
jgi:hypothetical protein